MVSYEVNDDIFTFMTLMMMIMQNDDNYPDYNYDDNDAAADDS